MTGEPLDFKAHAKLVLTQKANETRYREDPWTFLCEQVFTLDQITGQVRPFPSERDYLHETTNLWRKEKLFTIVKSRRMFITWAMVALHVWLARFHRGQKIAFAARKQGQNESEGSAELVWRAKFICEHFTPALLPVPMEYQFCRLTWPTLQSEIVGIGEGADQLRQHTCSAILADEFAFWDKAYETYVAARPTIEGGGRMTIVSTAGPGLYKNLVHDQL